MQLSGENVNGSQPTTETPSGEFMYLKLNQIVVAEQIRSRIDTTSAAFKALCESIRDRGVLEPILVARRGAEFILISGERRFMACKILGLATIPVRILENMEEKEAALSVQLTENLHRENLDPIDEAASYARYFQLKRGDCTIDEMLGIFVNLDLAPTRVDTASSQTASALMNIAGKSFRTLHRLLLLLKLPAEIQQALREEKISVSQGYLLAAEIDNPGLMDVFKTLLAKPLTNEVLKLRLSQARKQAAGQLPVVKADTVAKYKRNLRNIRVSVQMQQNALSTAQADDILKDLRELVALIERLRAEAALAAAQ